MRTWQWIFVSMVLPAALAACGDDSTSSTASSVATTASSVPSTGSSVAATIPVTSNAAAAPAQTAIWPAASVVFTTPVEAAGDFVRKVLGVEPMLGDFQQGDSRSGEIEVVFRGESGTSTPMVRSRLLMRQLAPSNGWFVLSAVNDFVSIDAPDSLTLVHAGPLVVSGVGRGFEATLNVTAYGAGSVARHLGDAIAMGGAYEKPEPYRATVDLSGAVPGDIVTIVVRGATGLDTDPGEFAAIAVIVGR